MRTFRLSDAAFAALAAGRPSAATLAELRKAQQSRHLLLLTEIHRLPGGEIPRWYAESTATAGSASADALADPMAALHTAATLAALRAGAEPPPDRIASSRRLTATHDGLTLRVRLEDTDTLRARLGLTPFRQLTDDEAAGWRTHLDEAWRILVTRHRPAAATLAAVLSVIVPLEPTSSAAGISATSADAYGAVAISPPADGRSLAVGLLHETQHSVLNAVRTLFDLVTPPASPGYSPWRDDPRPPFGILHGAYAYQAVTRFWRTEAATPESAADRRLAEFEWARWRVAVVAAADDLLGDGVLTAAGRRFVGAMRDEVSRWLAEPVTADVARLAAGANADHRARWRLRNLVVAPETVDALVSAWRREAPPPAVPEPAVRAGSGRALERSERLTLVHRLLRAPTADAGRRGDAAYLGGDHGTAFDAYLQELETRPAERALELWAGLAVVSPYPALRERPELVRALYQALRESRISLPGNDASCLGVDVDLRALAVWVGR